jgi:hypothetical protein
MKTKISSLIATLLCCAASAQITNLDTTTTFTNYSQSQSGAYIWIAGAATNAPYTAVDTNGISVGDSLATVRIKQNANNAFLQSEITNHAAWISNNVPVLNPLVTSLFTNVWGTDSNYLGTVQGIWSNSLVSITNYTTVSVLWSSSVIATNADPTTLTILTNGYTNAVSGYLAIYGNPTNGIFGDPLTVNLNSNAFYSGFSQPGLTLLGSVTNITAFSLAMTNVYSPSVLYVSGDGTNFWQIGNTQTTNQLYVALVTVATNHPPGGLQSLAIYNVKHQKDIGVPYPFHGHDFTVRDLKVEGNLHSAQMDANTAGLSNLTATVGALGSFVSLSNSWPLAFYNATNNLALGCFANFANSNGAAEYKIWNSNGVYWVYPQ